MTAVGQEVQPVTWLYADSAMTQAAAPLTTPRSAQPGPGSATLTDSANNASINASGEFVEASSAGARDPWYRNAAGHTRVAQRLFQIRFSRTSGAGNTHVLGWANTLSNPDNGQTYGIMLGVGVGNVEPDNVSLAEIPADAVYSRYTMLLLATGFVLFVGDNLVWECLAGSEATLYPHFAPRSASCACKVTAVKVRDSLTTFSPSQNVSTPPSGTIYPADADGMFSLTVTAPNPLLAGHKAELRYRYYDANDYWSAYFDEAGAFRLDSVVGGVARSRLNVAGVIAAGQTRIIRVYAAGTKHDCYTINGTTPTKQANQVDLSSTMDDAVNVQPVLSGYTASLLRTWSRSKAAWTAELART